MRTSRKMYLAAAMSAITLFAVGQARAAMVGGQAKNIILMMSDGQGFNTVQATNYYTGSQAVYQGADFVKVAMRTNSANNPAGYDPASMASSFTYSKAGATDSASAGTAMFTGVKNYDGTINWTTDGKPLSTFFETQASLGRGIGAVSSVEFSHATPAAVYGHNSSRNNYAAIATEGIYGSNPLDGTVPNSGGNPLAGNNGLYDALNYNNNLKVLMGAGSGDYNDNGVYDTAKSDNYAGGSGAWTDIKTPPPPNGWTLVESKADFEAVASGASNPDKLLGVARVNTTLQQARANPAGNFDAKNTNVPTLETMTRAALNVLDKDLDGFAVMIEGGAIDWANHANQMDRAIEEQMDFNASVQAVVHYLNAGTSGNDWTNTLLIVTADHETGHLWGDGTGSFFDVDGDNLFSPGVDYAHIVDKGAGNLPGFRYFSGDHTNQLVPLYAKGAGADLFLNHVIGNDPNLENLYNIAGMGFNGDFIDNTSVFTVMGEASAPVPVPGAVWLLGSGLAGLAGCRRRPARVS